MDFKIKVVSILCQVQENCSPEESRLLDKVMDFLKREGLYNPQIKEMRTDDPVATDLIGALLMVIIIKLINSFCYNDNTSTLFNDYLDLTM